MRQYLELMRTIRDRGAAKPDRTGTGTRSIFGYQMRFDLAAGFPLLTTKKLHTRSIIYELLWFLRGKTNNLWLKERGVRIWEPWADPDGELGPIYGYQWRSWPTRDGQHIDQISQVIQQIRDNPHSRRHIVCAWNVGELDRMALPPCHVLFQFYVSPPTETRGGDDRARLDNRGADNRARLSCQLYQRSADVFIGVPFNIASYALLTMMVAHVTGCAPGEFIHTFGDAHLYENHLEQVDEQLEREPRPLPTMKLNPEVGSIFEFTYEDFELTGYNPHPHIKAPVAV